MYIMDNKCFDLILDKINNITYKTMLDNNNIDKKVLDNLSLNQKLKVFCNYLDTIIKNEIINELSNIINICGKT